MRDDFHPIDLNRAQRERFARIRTLDQLQSIDPVDFERYCGFLYEQQGYKAYMTATSGDEGVDLWLTKGREAVVVQCKRYAGTVGQPTVRDLYGTMLHTKASAAVLITTGSVSRAAEEWAADKPIRLIDGHELISWARYTRSGSSGGGWLGSNIWRLALGAAGLVAVFLAVLAVLFGLRVLQERTGGGSGNNGGVAVVTPATGVPTLALPSATQPPTATTDPRTTPTLAPTATLRPTATPPAGQPLASFTLPYTDSPPALRVDDPFWATRDGIAPTHIVEQTATWDNSLDVSAVWKLAYDDRMLYGQVTVIDDVLAQTQPPRFAYRGDSLELEIATAGALGERATPSDYQYILSPGNFSDLPPGAFRFSGKDNTGVMVDDWGTQAQVVAQRTPDGYVLAFQIPLFDMRIYEPLTAGRRLALALNVNDNDDPTIAKQEFMLSNVPTRRWSQPTSWGSVTLGARE